MSMTPKFPTNFNCLSCFCNKSHRLPFDLSSITSRGLLDIIYTDVLGTSPIHFIDGFHYNLILMDHFTKFMWFYPLQFESDVHTVFPIFKAKVENYFNAKIVSIYSNGVNESTALKNMFSKFGITHLKTPLYIPRHIY